MIPFDVEFEFIQSSVVFVWKDTLGRTIQHQLSYTKYVAARSPCLLPYVDEGSGLLIKSTVILLPLCQS